MSYKESQESSIDFQKYWIVLKRRWLPASVVFGIIFALTAISLLLQKPLYEAEGKLLFKKTSPGPSLTGVGREMGELASLQEQINPVNTEAEVLRSIPIIQTTITKLDLKDKRGKILKPRQFLKKLEVTDIKKTDVLQVSYRDTDPKRAATVVNALMAVYLEKNLLTNRAAVVSAREFIHKQLPQSEKSLRQAESNLRRFQEENDVVALDEEAKSAVAVVADLQRQINTAQSELADAKAESDLLRKQLGINLQEARTITSISQLPSVQDVLKEVQEVESQLAVERSRFREEFPNIVSLKRKKTNLDRLLQQRLKRVFGSQAQTVNSNLQNSGFDQKLTEEFVRAEARRLGLSNQIAALIKVQANYRQRLNVLPQLQQKQRELERQLQASQATYSILLQKFQEIQIAENQNIGNARVIASAIVPDEPVASKALYLSLGIVLGILLALATALILETKDKSIKTVEEARKIFGFTLLGVIPSFKKAEKINIRNGNAERSTPEVVVKDSPRSPFSTAYRMLQANLKFLSSDKQLKVIVVTSSVPQEGKSTVSANLAVAMAQLGRKVLIVDADLHCPAQHQIWDLPNQAGLSNLLVGEIPVSTAIEHQVMVNLDVLTSGVIPPNPGALLDSQRMASLISMFSATYDFTIIDTPALSVDIDAQILGKMADGVLLVVRPGVVDSANAALAKEFLQQSDQNVLGQVLNGVIPENEPYSYYYFSKAYATESATKDENAFPHKG